MGDYKNVSRYWKFGLLDTDENINPGLGWRLFANQRRAIGSNHINFNLAFTFGEDAALPSPEHDNTRFCLKPLLDYMSPTDWCLLNDLTGNIDFWLKATSGGWFEGIFHGGARWSLKKDGPVIVMALPETSMNKNGKQAWVCWTYPGEVWSKGTRLILSGAYEARPMPAPTAIFDMAKRKPVFPG